MHMSTARPRRALLFAIVLVLLLDVAVFRRQKQLVLAGASDFSSFYAAARLLIAGRGAQVYDYAAQKEAQEQFISNLNFRHGPLPYVHPPFELLLFAALAYLRYPAAVIAWYAVNIVVFVRAMLLFAGRIRVLGTWVPWVLIAAAFFPPVLVALIQGQDSIVLLLLLGLVYLWLTTGHELRAGGLLALATFKPQFVLPLVLAFMMAKRWRLLAAFVAGCLALAGVSIALVGWHTTVAYPRTLLEYSRLPPNWVGAYPGKMPDVRGFLYTLLHARVAEPALRTLTVASSALLLIPVLWVGKLEGTRLSELGFSLCIVIALLAGFHVNDHDLTLLLLPLCLTANYLATPATSGGRSPSARPSMMVAMAAIYIAELIGVAAPIIFLVVLAYAIVIFREWRRKVRAPELQPA
jgi:hypothetical protein